VSLTTVMTATRNCGMALYQEEAPAAFLLNPVAQGQEGEEIGELDEEESWT
ncbi:Hypothetical protein FKW44_003025, partial [Caligus rogercresseyi]